MKIGILALQGDVREHLSVCRGLGAAAEPVKTSAELDAVDVLVLPGGESTTVGLLLAEHGMVEPVRKRLEDGMPAFGTCAGAILLASDVVGGDVPRPGGVDMTVHRNAYGRQVDSFEDDVHVAPVGMVRAVFIRAPVIERVGPDVEVLGEQNGRPVVVRSGSVLVATFHPELAGEEGLHRYFLEEVCG